MSEIFCRIDDKHVPLYRVLWVAATPHFCGEPECQCEGLHEVALEGGESVWARFDEKEKLLAMIEDWQEGLGGGATGGGDLPDGGGEGGGGGGDEPSA